MTPAILNYSDYRLFLKDLYQAKKSSRAGYSYRRFAADLGFNPSNYIHLVITGKRNLSPEAVDKIKSKLKWTAQQKKYFINLVLHNQSESAEQKLAYQNELDKILGKKRQVINPDRYAYFSTWYIPVIREILVLKGFTSSLDWIAHKLKPRVDKPLIKEALQILARLKMIVNEGKRWMQSEEHLTTPSEITSELIHNYHREQIKLSLMALELAPQARDISAMTMSLSKPQFEWLKQRLIDFRDEIQQELQSSTEEPTLVGQLNIQLFPVTED